MSMFPLLAARMILNGVTPKRRYAGRIRLGNQYIYGKGIEIGACHLPLPTTASVLYVDMFSSDQLRSMHFGAAPIPIVEADIIDRGELTAISDASMDFIIANHVIEHSPNPIQMIKVHLSKLVAGGILYYAVPDKRFTFDRKRPLSTFSHIRRDFEEAPELWGHYLEFVRLTETHPTEALLQREARRLMNDGYPIHFHVWDHASCKSFFEELAGYLPGIKLCDLKQNGLENIAVLQKKEQ
jgi:SAM-dependent methyltransferase